MVAILLWGSLSLLAYAFLVYPFALWLVAPREGATGTEGDMASGRPESSRELPFVTLVVAAYREERVILQRLRNAVELDYPAHRIEVLIGCDGEEDSTGELVRSFDDPRIRLVQFPRRRGKASVLNDCVARARGEILVFSDANTRMESQAVRRLVRHFRDPEVGGVSGELTLSKQVGVSGADGLYWRYENLLKRAEGRWGVVIAVNGAIYAIRRELYRPLPAATILDDFLIGMTVHDLGHRLMYDPSAKAFEEEALSMGDDFRRRVRLGAGALQALPSIWTLLSPRHGRLAFCLLSHKVLRWLGPFLLLTALFANAWLVGSAPYTQLLVAQALFYAVAAIGLVPSSQARRHALLRGPGLFVATNLALLVGYLHFLSRRRDGRWRRTPRGAERSVVLPSAPDGSRD